MKYILTGMVCLLFTGLVSCKKDTPENQSPTSEKKKIGSFKTPNNETGTLWADGHLTAGFQNIYLTLTDEKGGKISDKVVRFVPVMDMGSMSHSSPAIQPTYRTSDGWYAGAVIFTMASGSDHWMITGTVGSDKFSVPVTVEESATKTVGSYVGTDGNKYVLSLVPPKKWQVGMNDLEVYIHKNEMMNFPPADGFSIEFVPEMTSMGHGSPNNVHPINVGNGLYKGKVNYTMTGDWKLHFKLMKNGVVIVQDAALDILF